MKLKILFLFFCIATFGQQPIAFFSKNQMKVVITPKSNYEELEISFNSKIQKIDTVEVSLDDKPTTIQIDDYNFDGYKDFSTSHMDDGMGVYRVYQIFVFNHKKEEFEELVIPNDSDAQCGMFCDLIVNSKKKTFSSTCRGAAQWHEDVWKFDKEGKLILVNK